MLFQERELHLLRVLGRRRYLTADMLRELFYWDRSDRTCREYLRRLAEYFGMLGRSTFAPLAGYRGSLRPYVYWLTGKGARQVREEFQEEVSPPHGRRYGGAYDPTIEHTLAVNTLYVDLVAAWREGGNLVRLEWRDEASAMLRVPLATTEAKRRGNKVLHFRPDAFVSMALASQGTLPPAKPRYAPVASCRRWAAVQNWAEMFPDFSPPRTEGVEKVALQMAFVESDMGRSSREQLWKKLDKYRFVRRRPDLWVRHYGVPVADPGRKPVLWPGMLVLCQTERRMRALAEIFTHPTKGFEGFVLLACFAWDVADPASPEGKTRQGLVHGPVWYDPRGGRERLTLMEALRGLGKETTGSA